MQFHGARLVLCSNDSSTSLILHHPPANLDTTHIVIFYRNNLLTKDTYLLEVLSDSLLGTKPLTHLSLMSSKSGSATPTTLVAMA